MNLYDVIVAWKGVLLVMGQLLVGWILWSMRKTFVPRAEFEQVRDGIMDKLDRLETERREDMAEVREMFAVLRSGQNVQTAELGALVQRSERTERQLDALMTIHLETDR